MVMDNIGVIGIGKLGLSFALLVEHSGYRVHGCDTRVDYLDSLEHGTYQTSEPYINEWLPKATKLALSNNLSACAEQCDVLFCFVATPSLPDGSYDHSAIDRIVAELQELHVKGLQMDDKILVIGCTTMPGYCDTVQSRLELTGISVVYNPEFIAQGNIIDGLRYADMVLIGTQEVKALTAIRKVYDTIMQIDTFNLIRVMSRTAAEITKISINCFLTMKIAYANMIGEIAINSGLEREVDIILNAIGSDSRIGTKYLRYGFGYGGPCLPRDMRALGIHAIRNGVYTVVPEIIDDSNNQHAGYLKNYFIKQNPDKSVPFLFTQLAYKSGTGMLDNSQQYRLCKDLLDTGYLVDITESPSVIAQIQEELSQYGERVTYGTVTNGYKIDI